MFLVFSQHFLIKKNLIISKAKCDFCGTITNLKTFKGLKWATLNFIPIIPLGTKQVFNFCPHCEHYREISYYKWKKEALHKLKENEDIFKKSNDIDAGFILLELYAVLNKRKEGFNLAIKMENLFSNDFNVFLFLADWYFRMRDSENSNKCYIKAYNINKKDKALSLKLLDFYIATNNKNTEKHVKELEETFTDDVEIISKLAEWYNHNNRINEEYNCYMKILDIDKDNPEAKYNSVKKHIRDNNLLKAEEILLKDNNPLFKWDCTNYISLAVAYQKNSKYEKSYEILKIVAKNFKVKIEYDKNFRMLVKETEKILKIKKSILPMSQTFLILILLPLFILFICAILFIFKPVNVLRWILNILRIILNILNFVFN